MDLSLFVISNFFDFSQFVCRHTSLKLQFVRKGLIVTFSLILLIIFLVWFDLLTVSKLAQSSWDRVAHAKLAMIRELINVFMVVTPLLLRLVQSLRLDLSYWY